MSRMKKIALLLFCLHQSHGWMIPQSSMAASPYPPTTQTNGYRRSMQLCAKGPFGFLSPYESKIPDELREEIYAAEANTPAAQERGQRVALYAAIAVLGIIAAFFNAFLTDIRANGIDGEAVDLAEAGFGWVANNFFLSFFLLNKIGGGICLVGGAGAGLLAEAELDTKRINAEKIYEELERRREAKMKGSTKQVKAAAKRKRRSGKETKRMSALSEVVAEDAEPTAQIVAEESSEASSDELDETETEPQEIKTVEKKGIFGSVKELYEKADTMAASQALLLNKKLEEAGVVEKITDESGLKVIGREEAAKLEQDKKKEPSDK